MNHGTPLLPLIRALLTIEKFDPASPECVESNYTIRNKVIISALFYATQIGLECGIRLDPQEPEWPCVYINLPTIGQVSWHIPQFPQQWDGHTNEQKYERIHAFHAYLKTLSPEELAKYNPLLRSYSVGEFNAS